MSASTRSLDAAIEELNMAIADRAFAKKLLTASRAINAVLNDESLLAALGIGMADTAWLVLRAADVELDAALLDMPDAAIAAAEADYAARQEREARTQPQPAAPACWWTPAGKPSLVFATQTDAAKVSAVPLEPLHLVCCTITHHVHAVRVCHDDGEEFAYFAEAEEAHEFVRYLDTVAAEGV